MGPETMTDVVYYDVQQWYVDINAVKLKGSSGRKLERPRDNRTSRGHDIVMSKTLAIFFHLLNNSEKLLFCIFTPVTQNHKQIVNLLNGADYVDANFLQATGDLVRYQFERISD